MRKLVQAAAILLAAVALAGGCAAEKLPAPEIPNRDTPGYSFALTTADPRVQRLFDRGLAHAYVYEREAAEQLFGKALRIDSSCAMCYWGMVYAGRAAWYGGAALDAVDAVPLLRSALRFGALAGQREQAFIEAFRWAEEQDSTAFAGASFSWTAADMLPLLYRAPDDPDATTLYAEGLMRDAGWRLWQDDGQPIEATVEALGRLENVLARQPDHPGAQFLYLLALERRLPEIAIPVAERLAERPPGLVGLRRLPAHVFMRMGRYHDVARLLEQVWEEAPGDTATCPGDPGYDTWHYGEVLWSALLFEGRSTDAIALARHLEHAAASDSLSDPGHTRWQHIRSLPMLTLAWFGDWDRLYRQPGPPERFRYERSIWEFAQGVAALQLGMAERAGQAEQWLVAANEEEPANETTRLLHRLLAGARAAASGRYDAAVSFLEEAVALQEKHATDFTAPLYRPARQVLGDVLLEAGDPERAERVFEEDLVVYPENGRALWGLYRSLKVQQREAPARIALDRFNRAWIWADAD